MLPDPYHTYEKHKARKGRHIQKPITETTPKHIKMQILLFKVLSDDSIQTPLQAIIFSEKSN